MNSWSDLPTDNRRLLTITRNGKDHLRRVYREGTRYQYRGCGLDGGKVGILLYPLEVPRYESGIPKIPGSYKPMCEMLGQGWIYLRTNLGSIIEVPSAACWPV